MGPGKTSDSALAASGAGWVKGIWALFLAVSLLYLISLHVLAESTVAPSVSSDAEVGKDLFTGQAPFKNGGAACVSCHDFTGLEGLGGGTLARDLTPIYSRFGETGLKTFIKMAPIPVMKALYGDRPLTDEEAAYLVAFLRQEGRAEAPTANAGLFFSLAGLVGFLVVLGAMHLIWVGRLGGVRQPLVMGASQPVRGGPR